MPEVLLDDLRRQISSRQVLAVVGAGVSIGATNNNPLASWTGLLRDGVERCVQVVPSLPTGWPERVRSEIQSGDQDDLLSAAEKISSKLGSQGGEYGRWLRETVGSLKAERPEAIMALKDLGIPIATTNYDSLIEQVIGWPPVTWRQSAQVEYLIRGDEPGVLHLHGYWQDPQSVILGIRSYETLLGASYAQAIQRTLRATRTLLFIGYGEGLADPNFGALLRWTRDVFSGSEYRHYRLALQKDVARTQATHPPEERLYVLSFGEKYTDLTPFLLGLAGSQVVSPPEGGPPPRQDVPETGPSTTEGLRIFFSYSNEDERFRDELEVHMTFLKRTGVIASWHDRRVTPGSDWSAAIQDSLNQADIIILLVSSAFLASDYCYGIELKRAMERHKAGNARVIPIILRPTDWHSAPFGMLQALPRDAKPVTTWSNRDEAFTDIVRGIRQVALEVMQGSGRAVTRLDRGSAVGAAVGSVTVTGVGSSTVTGSGAGAGQELQVGPQKPKYQLGAVFLKHGEPTVTFVVTPQFRDLKLALSQPGRGVVIEGPSGIGKTTALRRALSELQSAGQSVAGRGAAELLSARQEAHVERLKSIQQWHRGLVAIDDFHRLPPDLYQRIVDHLKYLADIDAMDRKLVIVGIPRTNQLLVELSYDLALRVEVIPFNKVDDGLVLQMISQGEEALNIRFERKTEIALAAGGSLNIAQYLCFHIAKKCEIFHTQAQPKDVPCPIEQAVEGVLAELALKFRSPLRRFVLLGGTVDRTCVRLLEELKNSPDGALSLAELRETAPLIAGGLRRFKKQSWLNTLYVEQPDSQRLLYYDPQGDRLTIDDPQLGFYLRNISLIQFAKEAGIVQPRAGKLVVITYVKADQRLLDRLRLHLSPLERQKLVQVDVWEENRLSGQTASADLRKSIETAALAISLVSADYLASDFLEPDLGGLLTTLSLAAGKGNHIISLITRPCLLRGTGLDNYEVINPTVPLSDMTDDEMERTLVNVADLIASRIA